MRKTRNTHVNTTRIPTGGGGEIQMISSGRVCIYNRKVRIQNQNNISVELVLITIIRYTCDSYNVCITFWKLFLFLTSYDALYWHVTRNRDHPQSGFKNVWNLLRNIIIIIIMPCKKRTTLNVFETNLWRENEKNYFVIK